MPVCLGRASATPCLGVSMNEDSEASPTRVARGGLLECPFLFYRKHQLRVVPIAARPHGVQISLFDPVHPLVRFLVIVTSQCNVVLNLPRSQLTVGLPANSQWRSWRCVGLASPACLLSRGPSHQASRIRGIELLTGLVFLLTTYQRHQSPPRVFARCICFVAGLVKQLHQSSTKF